jgi:two-component system CheB/CheR fusion protein
VDESFRILRSRGRTGAYLELPSGEATLDALKLARPGLLSPLRTALQTARESGSLVRKEGVPIQSDGGELRAVSLEVTPLGRGDNRHYLVLFDAGTTSFSPPASSKKRRKAAPSDQALLDHLRSELAATQLHQQSMIQDLEAANEELQSANEEILSSNEELQSTNEELDTAREELQATNEELSTVNDELQGRNVELGRVNSDLLNLLASVQIPIVMVSNRLEIRRFTPAAERALNLIVSDVGRSIAHIKPNINCPDLEHLIREVIDTVTVCEREVEDTDGHVALLTIRPYKDDQNRIDGAVLALLELPSSVKLARAAGDAALAAVREPVILLGTNQKVQRANQAFRNAFRLEAAEIEGRSLYDLDGGAWNIPALKQLLENVLPQHKNFDDFVMEHVFPKLGQQRLLLSGRSIQSDRREDGVVVLIIRGVSDGP